MSGGMYVLVQCVLIFIDVASIAMLGRAVLSWFTMGGQTKIGAFLYVVTELCATASGGSRVFPWICPSCLRW